MTVAACAIALSGFLEPCAVCADDTKPSDGQMRPWAPIGISFIQPKWQIPDQTNSVFGTMINISEGDGGQSAMAGGFTVLPLINMRF